MHAGRSRSVGLAWFAMGLLAELLDVSVSRADCTLPSTLRHCNTHGMSWADSTFDTTAPAQFDSVVCGHCTFVGPACEGYMNYPAAAVGFDVPAGIVYARAKVPAGDPDYAPVGATSRDQYRITGPASAEPIACAAQFAVGGTGGTWSEGTASFTVQSQTASQSYVAYPPGGPALVPISGVMTLPVSAMVDQPFEVVLSAQVTGHLGPTASGYVYGKLTFAGLPPGYTVVSCKGFGAPATVTVRRSWGSLKGANHPIR